MRDIASEIEAKGARLVLIGNGTPERGRELLHETGVENLPFRLVLDPQLVGYRAAQLERPLLLGVRPRTAFAFFRAWRKGLRGGRKDGDAHELGGAFVLCPRNGVVYSFVCRTLGDQPSFEKILETLERLRLERELSPAPGDVSRVPRKQAEMLGSPSSPGS